jgi:coproporphyrinogen III oxidase
MAEAAVDPLEARKERARAWFEDLRDQICSAFEALEDEAPGALYRGPAGRFERKPWTRTDHTGGRPISGLPEIGTSSAGAARADPDGGGGRWR